jgi:hypothetical protein
MAGFFARVALPVRERKKMSSLTHCSIANEAADREQVYRLRYAGYFRKASIDAREDQRFSDHFDNLPNHFSFLAKDAEGEAQATVRISVVRPDLGWFESSACSVFDDQPALAAAASQGFVEASRLVFAPRARRGALMQLLGHMAAMADFYQTEWLVACPRMEHSGLYQRQFGFRVLAGPRPYHGVKFETQLLGVRREELRENVRGEKVMRDAWLNALTNLLRVRGAGRVMLRHARSSALES